MATTGPTPDVKDTTVKSPGGLSTFEASTYVPTAVWSAEGCAPAPTTPAASSQGLAHWAPFPAAAWRLELTEILGGEPRHKDPGAFHFRTSA